MSGEPMLLAAMLALLVGVVDLIARRRPVIKRTHSRSRDPADQEHDVAAFAAALAGSVRAGLTPHHAVSAVAGPQWVSAIAAEIDRGSELDVACERVAVTLDDPRSARALNAIALAVRVSRESGSSLGDALDSIAGTVDARARADADRAAAMAAPMATARLLAWLPLAGLALGEVIGAAPLKTLLDGGIGTAIALLGLVFVVVGRRWTATLVAQATAAADGSQRRSRTPGGSS